jgi:hypothetical protein
MHSSGTCPALVRVVNAIVDHASGVVPDGAGWLHVSVTMERLPLRLRRWFWRARGSIGMNDTGIEAAILRSFVSFPMTQAIIIIPCGLERWKVSSRPGQGSTPRPRTVCITLIALFFRSTYPPESLPKRSLGIHRPTLGKCRGLQPRARPREPFYFHPNRNSCGAPGAPLGWKMTKPDRVGWAKLGAMG